MNPKNDKKVPPPLSLRLTEEERQKLEQDARGKTLSEHIRECVFGENQNIRKLSVKSPVKDQVALAKLLGLLGQSWIANNLNQLAKHANSGSILFDQETADQINEAYDHVLSMRAELVRALGLIEERDS